MKNKFCNLCVHSPTPWLLVALVYKEVRSLLENACGREVNRGLKFRSRHILEITPTTFKQNNSEIRKQELNGDGIWLCRISFCPNCVEFHFS